MTVQVTGWANNLAEGFTSSSLTGSEDLCPGTVAGGKCQVANGGAYKYQIVVTFPDGRQQSETRFLNVTVA